MKGKIALEEHFATEEYLQDVKRYFIHEGVDVWELAKSTMCDISGKRLELMDEAGIEKTILSLSSPTIQSILSTEKAIDAAKRINDYTAEQIHDHRDRFEAFAAWTDPHVWLYHGAAHCGLYLHHSSAVVL